MAAEKEIFDKTIDSLEMTVRSSNVLKSRFGPTVLVRELAMLSENDLTAAVKAYHKFPSVVVNDIKEALTNVGLTLGMSWSLMPPSMHSVVRNPRLMLAHKNSVAVRKQPKKSRKKS